jgi:hypothetical protein
MALAVPSRPPNLSDRQWRALKQGLSWDREKRSISVRDWLAMLNPPTVALESIPRPQRVDAAPSPPAKFSAARSMVALGLVLGCLSAGALFHRPARMGMTATAQPATPSQLPQSAVALADVGRANETQPLATPPMATPSEAQSLAASSGPEESAPRALTKPSTPTKKAAAQTHRAARLAASQHAASRHAARGINIASTSYRVPRGANFAEVRVRRKSALGRSSFEWWTEESTALSGVDYVSQPPAKVTFLRGSHTASLFVKLLGDSARRQNAKFNVVIGEATKGTLVGLSRAQIVLAPGAAAPRTPIS